MLILVMMMAAITAVMRYKSDSSGSTDVPPLDGAIKGVPSLYLAYFYISRVLRGLVIMKLSSLVAVTHFWHFRFETSHPKSNMTPMLLLFFAVCTSMHALSRRAPAGAPGADVHLL